MPIRFLYGETCRKADWLPSLFDIRYTNMSVIAPTGCSYEEDYAEWFSHVSPALDKTLRRIVLIYDQDDLIGYFQYYVNPTTSLFMMEEIQLRSAYHRTGVFSDLYRWLLPQLPLDLQTVEAYAHKNNEKSQAILGHLGLSCIGEEAGGNILHFRGSFGALQTKYTHSKETGIGS